MRIAIIGGGMAGLGAAYELAQSEHDVTLFERGVSLGGLSAAVSVEGTPLEVYYHHLFPTYEDIKSVANAVGVGEKLFFKDAKTGTFFGGTFWSFNGALDLLRFTPLKFHNRIRAGIAFAYLKLIKSEKRFEGVRAVEWLRKWFGEEGYTVLWKPLLTSKFGEKADTISMVWLWGRIYERPTTFGYFQGGIQVFVDALESFLRNQGVSIKMQEAVERIEKEGETFRIQTARGAQEFDQVIVTTPPRPLLKFAGELFESDYRMQLEKLDYVGTVCGILVLDRPLTEYYWTNVSDPSPFVAIVEHTNFVNNKQYGGKHIVYLGRYVHPSDPFYAQSDEQVWDAFLSHLPTVNPSFSRDWVLKKYLFRAPFTQPITPVSYHLDRPSTQTPVDGLYWVSMSHVYPWDRGVDHSFKIGRNFAKKSKK